MGEFFLLPRQNEEIFSTLLQQANTEIPHTVVGLNSAALTSATHLNHRQGTRTYHQGQINNKQVKKNKKQLIKVRFAVL